MPLPLNGNEDSLPLVGKYAVTFAVLTRYHDHTERSGEQPAAVSCSATEICCHQSGRQPRPSRATPGPANVFSGSVQAPRGSMPVLRDPSGFSRIDAMLFGNQSD
ncbi:MAG TPA: hypothetical protein VKB76_07280 [Ktedonobacterales bacterium]|nr:hypothetical protein [Ktedonobacterales bacterium]